MTIPTAHTIPTSFSKLGQCNICRAQQVALWTVKGLDYCRECKDWLLKNQKVCKQWAGPSMKETSDVAT